MEKEQQEMMIKFQMFEQQIKAIQQQLQVVEQTILELEEMHVGMEDLIGGVDSEILAPIGRGIFVKAKVTSEDLIVDIGEKNYVNKSIPETRDMIKEQLVKLGDIKTQLEEELDKINGELTKVFMESQGHGSNECNCSGHGEDDECSCGDECSCK